jgi:hypothetical protein
VTGDRRLAIGGTEFDWMAHLPMCRNFSAVREHCPPDFYMLSFTEVTVMPSLLLEISVEELKKLLLQLPPAERLSLMEEIAEQSETLVMMQLSESGFQEWLEEGEDIYDAEAQELMRETEKDEKTGGRIS